MHIRGGIGGIMLYLDCISSTARPSFVDNSPCSDGHYRSPFRGCIIYTGMRSDYLENRMSTRIGKSRCYSEKIKRCLQKSFFKTLPLFIPIFITIQSIRKTHRIVGFIFMNKFHILPIVYIYNVSLIRKLLIKDLKVIALLKSKKIYCPCINI